MKSWIAAFTSGAVAAYMTFTGTVAFAAAPGTASTGNVSKSEAAAAGAPASANAKPDAGGFAPCLLTCYLGPRVGTEYNEGRGVGLMEWLQLVYVGKFVLAFSAMGGTTMSDYAKENSLDSRPIPPPHGKVEKPGGFGACLIAFYLGPRVAFEHNQGRGIRVKDWLVLVYIGGLLQALEAYSGKTMTQIAKDEGLDG
jgi:hypothetical protein